MKKKVIVALVCTFISIVIIGGGALAIYFSIKKNSCVNLLGTTKMDAMNNLVQLLQQNKTPCTQQCTKDTKKNCWEKMNFSLSDTSGNGFSGNGFFNKQYGMGYITDKEFLNKVKN